MKTINMRENQTPGSLITFCGLDGSGKTTAMQWVIDYLEKEKQVFVTQQPTTFVRESKIFRTYMDTPSHDAYDYRSLSLLAASDRVQHVNKVIEPAMKCGQVVLSDRYFYSCLANLRARGYTNDMWIYEIAESIIKPDIAFFFDVPVDIALERVRSRPAEKTRYIDIDLQYKLRDEYIKICEACGGILISTEESKEECFSKIKTEIERMLK